MNNLKTAFRNFSGDRGFTLPITLAMGIIMILVGIYSKRIKPGLFSMSEN